MPDQRMFSTADVEIARQRLNDNRYGGPDDLHDLDREDIHEIVQLVLTATWDRIYDEGLAEGRRQATEGPIALSVAADLTDDEAAELKARFQQAMQRPAVMTVLPSLTEVWVREWGVRFATADEEVYSDVTEAGARALVGRNPQRRALVSRLVGPWEPEHAFDESSVVNPATGEPYRGSSGPEPYEPPDPLCVCGAPWLGDEGCLTRQPGWTPPPPYDGPSIEELLPGGEPDEQPEAARNPRYGALGRPEPYFGSDDQREPGCPTCSGPVRETVGMICQTCGTDYASGGVVEPSGPLTAEHACQGSCVVLGLGELLDTDEEIEADAVRTARLPENPPGVGWRLARDEEIQAAADERHADAAHMAAGEAWMEHDAEQGKGGAR